MVKLLPILGFLLVNAAVLPGALAQSQTASCTRDIGLVNSQNQDACAVGIEVGKICDPGFNIPPVPVGSFYGGPLQGRSTQCICSTVYFTLLTVCGVCQGVDEVPWSTWNINCTTKTESDGNVSGSFPVPIPQGLDIPHWAFTPLLQNGSIDPVSIQADKQPDVTGSSTTSSTSSSATATPSSPVNTNSPTPSPSQTPSSDNNNQLGGGGGGTNAGAIAGGVVGGLVFLALLAVLAFFLRRRRARNKGHVIETRHPQTMMQTASPTSPGWSSPETIRDTGNGNLNGHNGMPSYFVDHSFGSRSPTPPKLYNPDDPATFPPAVSHSIQRSTSPGQPTINSTFSSAFPQTTPSEHGEWHPYRGSTASPEI